MRDKKVRDDGGATNGVPLSMSVRTRLALEVILRQQRFTPGSDDYDLLLDIRDKVGYSDAERALFVRQMADKVELAIDVVNSTPDVIITLDKAEARKLCTWFKAFPCSMDDDLWAVPLRKQLKEAGVW